MKLYVGHVKTNMANYEVGSYFLELVVRGIKKSEFPNGGGSGKKESKCRIRKRREIRVDISKMYCHYE